MSQAYDPKRTTKKTITPGNNRQGNLPASNLSRVLPRQLSTGSNRGEMTVKGLIRITDGQGITRMIMGYKKDAF